MSRDCLRYEQSGNQKECKTLIVFLHGWPDNFKLWDSIIHDFEANNLCLNISYNVNEKCGITFPTLI